MVENPNSLSKLRKTNSPSIKSENTKLLEKNVLLSLPVTNSLTAEINSSLFSPKHVLSENHFSSEKEIVDMNIIESSLINNLNYNNSFTSLNNRLNSVKNLSNLLAMTAATITQNTSNVTLQQNPYLYNSMPQFPLNLKQHTNQTSQVISKPPFLNPGLLTQNNLLQKFPITDRPFHSNTLNVQKQKSTPLYYCFLCSKQLENQSTYMLHWNLIHFKSDITSVKSKPNFLQELQSSSNNLQMNNLLASNVEKIVNFF